MIKLSNPVTAIRSGLRRYKVNAQFNGGLCRTVRRHLAVAAVCIVPFAGVEVLALQTHLGTNHEHGANTADWIFEETGALAIGSAAMILGVKAARKGNRWMLTHDRVKFADSIAAG